MAISENGDTLTYQNDLGQSKEAVGVVVLNSIGGGAVDSVNGQTGEVVLTAADIGALPDTYAPTWGQVTDKPAVIAAGANAGEARTAIGLGTAATQESTAFATAAQGATADTAVQPGDLSAVATSGSYNDLGDTPTLGTAASSDTGDFATAAQGELADTALQPTDLSFATVSALEGDWRGEGVETLGAALLALQAEIVP